MRKNEKLKDIIGEGAQDDEMKQKILELIDENPSEEARDAFATLNSKVFSAALCLLCADFLPVCFTDFLVCDSRIFFCYNTKWRIFWLSQD